MWKGVIATLVYVAGVTCAPFYLGKVPTSANEWGDYFAGFLAPVAIAWFIATLALQRRELVLQRDELALQREEMSLTRGVMKDQNEIQLQTAKANREANELTASNNFLDNVPQYISLLDTEIVHICLNAPANLTNADGGETRYSVNASPFDLKIYIEWLVQENINIDNEVFSEEFVSALQSYQIKFSQFELGAERTNNLLHVEGQYHDLWAAIQSYLDTGDD